MIRPNVQLSGNAQISYYSLVVAVAKRAREIAAEAELKGEILIEKPVDLAIDEYIAGNFKIVAPGTEEQTPGNVFYETEQIQAAIESLDHAGDIL